MFLPVIFAVKHIIPILSTLKQSLNYSKDYAVKNSVRDSLSGPVVKNLPSNAGTTGSIPGQGTKIPPAKRQLRLSDTTTEPGCLD